MLLRAEFLNGHFGDPALYIRQINGRRAMLFDCGDLTRFTTRQLMRVSHIFVSHCHIDHFFGFDLYLRVHIGSEKTTTVMGPPETSERLAGKLRSYTWNLIQDQNLEFIAVDLDPKQGQRKITRFHARDAFRPSAPVLEDWVPQDPVLDVGTFRVFTGMMDHRTPSMAYSIEEKRAVSLDTGILRELSLKPGPWIERLKMVYLFGGLETETLSVEALEKGPQEWRARELADRLLVPHERHKIAYVTDGAAHAENRQVLLPLIRNADLLFCETCFLQEDEDHARDTQHFTAEFIGRLAQEAQVKQIAPIHFSKRYLGEAERVLQELSRNFQGEVLPLTPATPPPRL